MATVEALVLSWSVYGLTIRCPFEDCPDEVHRHGCTLPEKDSKKEDSKEGDSKKKTPPNERSAHCKINGQPLYKSYRLVFPFEKCQLIEGLGWELDRRNFVWRTVGLNIVDVTLSPTERATTWHPVKAAFKYQSKLPDVPDSDDEDSISTKLQKMNLEASESTPAWKEKQHFDAHCVSNEIGPAEALLKKTKNPRALIDTVEWEGSKPILVMASENGHLDVVILLLRYEPSLEMIDPDTGRTALMAAVFYGRGTVALALLAAGCSLDCRSDDGENLVDMLRSVIPHVQDLRDYLSKAAEHFHDGTDHQTRVERLNREITDLKKLLQECKDRQEVREPQGICDRVVALHGSDQARHLLEHESWDLDMLTTALQTRIKDTPADGETKTVGCLDRGTCFRRVTAVSGWKSGAFGGTDGALDRPSWVPKVREVAEIVEHDFLSTDTDDRAKQPKGTYYACHVEKQLLAYMIWNHTTSLGLEGVEHCKGNIGMTNVNDSSDETDSVYEDDAGIYDHARELKASAPKRLVGLKASIYICQPAKPKPIICADCQPFCAKISKVYGLHIEIHGLSGGRMTLLQEWIPEDQ